MQHQNNLSSEDSSELTRSIQTQCNSCWKGPQEVSSPTSSSKQGQLGEQIGLFRAFSSPILKTSKAGYQMCSLGYLPHCPVSSWGESLYLYPAQTAPIISCPPSMYYCEGPISISLMGPWALWSNPFSVICKLGGRALQQVLQDTNKDDKQDRSHKNLDKQSPLALVCDVCTPRHLLWRTKGDSET